MFERFADGARRATALASEEARQLGHDFIGTEHMLLGLLALGEGVAFDALSELEVTAQDARQRVTELVHPVRTSATSSPPFTPLAKKSLERALREALQLGDNHIGAEHLLLGLTDVPDGGGARVLEELTGDLSGVRQAVLSRLPARSAGASRPVQASSPRTETAVRLAGAKASRTLRSRLWAPRVETPDTATAQASGPAPRCPTCGATLADEARYLVVMVAHGDPDIDPEATPAPAGDPVPEPVAVTVLYCQRCGNALGLA